MNAAVLVPRRSDGGRRDEVWAWIRERWATEHPDVPVIEGHDDGPGKFNRGLAINRAATQADADVLIIADSDTFCSAEQIEAACRVALDPQAPSMVLAYDVYRYLSRQMSDRVMAGYDGWWGADYGIGWSMTDTCSSMVVVTRRLFDEVGGFDEGFVGWGFEDVAFSVACQTFGGGLARVKGDAWHLWHVTSPENHNGSPEWERNRRRHLLYGDAAYHPEAMRFLLDTIHGHELYDHDATRAKLDEFGAGRST